MSASHFDAALASLDLGLFSAVESQTSDGDRRSLLACHVAARAAAGEFTYLEIGSHLGGSLQTYIRDPHCVRTYSIDKRTPRQDDARGVSYAYAHNSRQRMLDALATVPGADLGKLVCFDADAADVDVTAIQPRPLLCFIDGEHTDAAVRRDFAFCRRVLAANGAIVFHDASVIYLGLTAIVDELARDGVRVRAYHLQDKVFVIEFGACAFHGTPAIADMLLNNHVGYLASLRDTDHYRAFANRPMFRTLRKVRQWFTRSADRASTS